MKWVVIGGMCTGLLVSGGHASADAAAAIKTSPATLAQTGQRLAAAAAIESVRRFEQQPSMVTQKLSRAAAVVRYGVGLAGATGGPAMTSDSLHLRVKSRGAGMSVALLYQF